MIFRHLNTEKILKKIMFNFDKRTFQLETLKKNLIYSSKKKLFSVIFRNHLLFFFNYCNGRIEKLVQAKPSLPMMKKLT